MLAAILFGTSVVALVIYIVFDESIRRSKMTPTERKAEDAEVDREMSIW